MVTDEGGNILEEIEFNAYGEITGGGENVSRTSISEFNSKIGAGDGEVLKPKSNPLYLKSPHLNPLRLSAPHLNFPLRLNSPNLNLPLAGDSIPEINSSTRSGASFKRAGADYRKTGGISGEAGGETGTVLGAGGELENLFVGAYGIKYDGKTNLHYMRYRWYSNDQMRFISPDLLLGINRYAYCNNNPVNYTDILGLKSAIIHIYYVGHITHYSNEYIDNLRKQGHSVIIHYVNNHDGIVSNLQNSFTEADYIIIRGHGVWNAQKFVFGFDKEMGRKKYQTLISFEDIRIALEKTKRVKTKIIFADSCYGAHIKNKRLIDTLKDVNGVKKRRVKYIASDTELSTIQQISLYFISNDINGMSINDNL